MCMASEWETSQTGCVRMPRRSLASTVVMALRALVAGGCLLAALSVSPPWEPGPVVAVPHVTAAGRRCTFSPTSGLARRATAAAFAATPRNPRSALPALPRKAVK